jgi:hypothetical protein
MFSSTFILLISIIFQLYHKCDQTEIANNDELKFEYAHYNFSLTENEIPSTSKVNHHLNSKYIGQVRAVYNGLPINTNLKYRIVPSLFDDSMIQQTNGDESAGVNLFQIDQDSGVIRLRENTIIDREKFLTTTPNNDQQQMTTNFDNNLINQQYSSSNKNDNNQKGLISLNIEVSHSASYSYAYCLVSIVIEDINDNPPIAKIRPLPPFQSTKLSRQQNSIDLLVSQHTNINQILAYVGIYDPDAGLNGTINNIDLILLNAKGPSDKTIAERQLKSDTLFATTGKNLTITESVEDKINVPFQLKQIGNKLYNVQLTAKLNYKLINEYLIEMRCRDSGEPTSLVGISTIRLRVRQDNEFEPVFLPATIERNQKLLTNIPILDNYESAAPTLTTIHVQVEEKQGSFVKILTLNSIDLDDGPNGIVQYKIINNPYLKIDETLLAKTFRLDAETGVLWALRSFNLDDQIFDSSNEPIKLEIIAQDQGQGQNLPQRKHTRRTSRCNIFIHLIDINDNPPKFIDLSKTNQNHLINSNDPINIQFTLNKNNNNSDFIQIASFFKIFDADSFTTNKKNNNNQLDKVLEDHANFLYRNNNCLKTLKMKIEEKDEENNKWSQFNPFFFIISSPLATTLNSNQMMVNSRISCDLSIWMSRRFLNNNNNNNNQFDFDIVLSDYGTPLEQQSRTSFSVKLTSQKSDTNRVISSDSEHTQMIETKRRGQWSNNLVVLSKWKKDERISLLNTIPSEYQIINTVELLNNGNKIEKK